MAESFEAPFVFLLRGRDRALLVDTGAVADRERRSLRAEVDRLIGDLPLVVAHTHGHRDHVGGDGQFTDRGSTVIVDHKLEAVQRFFGLQSWPADVVSFDLGDRELRVTGMPGHHPASIAIIDPSTRWLLPGDTVYPGRLYVEDLRAFTASVDRVAKIAAVQGTEWVLGCHIELTATPGRDHPFACTYHSSEPPIEQPARVLDELAAALQSSQRPGVHRFDDFIVVNGSGLRSTGGLLLRGSIHRFRERILAHRTQHVE